MKLERAIEIKENNQRLHLDEYYQELLEADKMSIEAMKQRQQDLEGNPLLDGELLPGETEE